MGKTGFAKVEINDEQSKIKPHEKFIYRSL